MGFMPTFCGILQNAQPGNECPSVALGRLSEKKPRDERDCNHYIKQSFT